MRARRLSSPRAVELLGDRGADCFRGIDSYPSTGVMPTTVRVSQSRPIFTSSQDFDFETAIWNSAQHPFAAICVTTHLRQQWNLCLDSRRTKTCMVMSPLLESDGFDIYNCGHSACRTSFRLPKTPGGALLVFSEIDEWGNTT